MHIQHSPPGSKYNNGMGPCRDRRATAHGEPAEQAGKARPPPPRAGWRTRAAVRAPEPRHGEKDGKGCPALGMTVAGRALRRRRGDHRHRRGAG